MIDLIKHIFREFPLIKWGCILGLILVVFGSPPVREIGFWIFGLVLAGLALIYFLAEEWKDIKNRDK